MLLVLSSNDVSPTLDRELQAKFEITEAHFPFNEKVCNCTISGTREPHGKREAKEHKCKHGEYNVYGVQEKVADLIMAYFRNGESIPDWYRFGTMVYTDNE